MTEVPIIDRIVRSKRKTVALVVTPDGLFEVRAPRQLTQKQIEMIVEERAGWISKHLVKALQNAAKSPRRELTDGSRIWYLGKSYPLRLIPGSSTRVRFEDGFSLQTSSHSNAERLLTGWYKRQARVIFTDRAEKYSRHIKLDYSSIRISSAQTRWGSCGRTNTLSFTWRLVMAPMEIIDYVIIHELAHTKFKNHSRDFWVLMENLLPDFRRRRAWLRANGRQLDLSIEADPANLDIMPS